MERAQEHQFYIRVADTDEAGSPKCENVTNQSTTPRPKYKWWLLIATYSFFILGGQSVSALLLRLYFAKGGKSDWMATLLQVIGFPILLFLRALPSKNPTSSVPNQTSILLIALAYVVVGILIAASAMLSSIGLSYLPVSTYSLILASQLAFNAFFSYFLNAQKFTPFIVNSVVLLTISSILLVTQNESTNLKGIFNVNYTVGFVCTLCSSAGSGLMLSLTQFFFRKIFRSETFGTVLDLIISASFVASCAALVGFFASGDAKDLKIEMKEFALGKLSYVMILIGAAVAGQVTLVGSISLVSEVSAVFSNVISALALPLVPILAVIFFHDKMTGVKVISLLLAIWGFVSYNYQHYLDDCESQTKTENINEVFEALPTEREAN